MLPVIHQQRRTLLSDHVKHWGRLNNGLPQMPMSWSPEPVNILLYLVEGLWGWDLVGDGWDEEIRVIPADPMSSQCNPYKKESRESESKKDAMKKAAIRASERDLKVFCFWLWRWRTRPWAKECRGHCTHWRRQENRPSLKAPDGAGPVCTLTLA